MWLIFVDNFDTHYSLKNQLGQLLRNSLGFKSSSSSDETFDGDYDVLLSKVVSDITKGLPPVSRFTPLSEFYEPWQLEYLQEMSNSYPLM